MSRLHNYLILDPKQSPSRIQSMVMYDHYITRIYTSSNILIYKIINLNFNFLG